MYRLLNEKINGETVEALLLSNSANGKTSIE